MISVRFPISNNPLLFRWGCSAQTNGYSALFGQKQSFFRGAIWPKMSFLRGAFPPTTSSGSPAPALHNHASRSETPPEAVQLRQGVTHKKKCHKCTAPLSSLRASILLLLMYGYEYTVYVYTRHHMIHTMGSTSLVVVYIMHI